MKTLLSSGYDLAWKTWMRLSDPPRGRYPIVHQGIQRSGTNYLCAVLEIGDYRVLNRIDPGRSNPRHKHFRWQDDKTGIVMDRRYLNRRHVQGIDEVNRICRYPAEQRHVVLFRRPRDWIDAIYRWGLSNDWFADEAQFVEGGLARAYLREWHGYYAKWEEMADRDPERVLILDYLDLRTDPGAVLARVDAFQGVSRPEGAQARESLAGGIGKVRHSKPMSEKREGLSAAIIDRLVAEEGAFNWERHGRED
ncbi:hypothetical protein [Pseudooceanicola marinus]|uniref:hypothetical protein n=1 Tax=Pseudooceanicola marinus TaxID=396013 RepID=UPI001CD35480|nr:hypothetical protein [Pseudooceanicola marinus]MCA1338158.1 hypothetical protein [Pseudooceanicola marinus]